MSKKVTKKDLRKAQKRLAKATRACDERRTKVLKKLVANEQIGPKAAKHLFASEEGKAAAQAKLDELVATKERAAAKKAKKAQKKAAKKQRKQEGVQDAAVAEVAAAPEPTKEQRAFELSEFAYAPTRNPFLPNPSNPYSDEDYLYMRVLLEQRVKPSRFEHSLRVAETAEKMAHAYDLDAKQARMAGLLHDWDKALSHERLACRVADYALPIDAETVATKPWLLHGMTAAAVLRDQFPLFRSPVFQAVDCHTTAACGMEPLDMVVFCADKLEPGHDVEEYRKLHDQIGELPLEDLFFHVLKEGLLHILQTGRPMNRASVEVWNWYIEHLQIGEEAAN